MKQAPLIEIFQSLQGEGPYAGDPMIFVRFQDCDLHCRYCDTPDSFRQLRHCRVEQRPGAKKFDLIPNPIDLETLGGLLSRFDAPILSITGGEPLQHVEFLKNWLPGLMGQYQILLETNGVLASALAEILDWVDIISMDIKLPSATGMRPFWQEHEDFIKKGRVKELYAKVVLGDPTPPEELQQALDLVRTWAPKIPFILQPMTPRDPQMPVVPAQKIEEYLKISKGVLRDVRVIPQRHVEWGIL